MFDTSAKTYHSSEELKIAASAIHSLCLVINIQAEIY
jgi:hypothetical protein